MTVIGDFLGEQVIAIIKIGGVLPENIPADEHIKQEENRIKSTSGKLALEEKDAKDLLGCGKNSIEDLYNFPRAVGL